MKPITQGTAGTIYKCLGAGSEDPHDRRRLILLAPLFLFPHTAEERNSGSRGRFAQRRFFSVRWPTFSSGPMPSRSARVRVSPLP